MNRPPPDGAPRPGSSLAVLAGRIALGILSLALVILGFFFLAAALVAGTIVAGVLLLRLWWYRRRLERAAARHVIDTEYTVVEREPPAETRLPPPH